MGTKNRKTKYLFSATASLVWLLLAPLLSPLIPPADAEAATTLLHHCFPYTEPAPFKAALIQTTDMLFGFSPDQPESILQNQISLCAFATQPTPVHTQMQTEQSVPTHGDLRIEETKQTVAALQNTEGENKQIYIDNDTDFDIDIASLLREPLALTLSRTQPAVLIVHTHTTESYTPDGQTQYSATDSTRTLDPTQNVVRIGEEIARTLADAGIQVLHDTSVNDHPSYSGSYTRTLSIIEDYLARYPSIRIVLDIHRDAMVKADGTKLKLTADLAGEKVAQVMLVVGSNAGGLPHDAWRENLKFGLQLQNRMTLLYPGLARPLNLRTERFNQHATPGSIIVEVGTDGNTLPEAIRAGKHFALALTDLLRSLN